MEYTDRQLKLLSETIKSFIETSEPVGSKTLSAIMGVCSATIRSEMAVLEQIGFLEQPHTSAGRIPTHKAFRIYVNQLMDRNPLTVKEKAVIDDLFSNISYDPELIPKNIAHWLSNITNCATISVLPTQNDAKVSKIEFIRTGKQSLLIVVIINTGAYKSGMCKIGIELESEIIGNFFDSILKDLIGKKLAEMTPEYIQSLANSTGFNAFVLAPILFTIYEISRNLQEKKSYVEGESKILECGEYDSETACSILSLLQAGIDIPNSVSTDMKVNVLIGEDVGFKGLDNSTLLLSGYSLGKLSGGAFGIIGPIRMNYAKLIPHVEYFSYKLKEFLDTEYDQD